MAHWLQFQCILTDCAQPVLEIRPSCRIRQRILMIATDISIERRVEQFDDAELSFKSCKISLLHAQMLLLECLTVHAQVPQ